jgi:hypothetical protein
MRPIKLSQTGVGSQVHNTNWRQNSFKIGFGAAVTGTATFTIRHTFENPNDFTDKADFIANATWYPHEFVVDATASQDGNYFFPISAIMLDVTVGTGTVDLTALQAL